MNDEAFVRSQAQLTAEEHGVTVAVHHELARHRMTVTLGADAEGVSISGPEARLFVMMPAVYVACWWRGSAPKVVTR